MVVLCLTSAGHRTDHRIGPPDHRIGPPDHLGTVSEQRCHWSTVAGQHTMVNARDQVVCAQCDEGFRLSDVGLTRATRPSSVWHCATCSEARARCDLVQRTALVTVDWEHYGVFQGEVQGVEQEGTAKHHLVWYRDDKTSEWHDLEKHGGVVFVALSDVPSSNPAAGDKVNVPNLWTTNEKRKKGKKGKKETVDAVVVRAARVDEPLRPGVKWAGKVIHLLEYCGECHWHCFGEGVLWDGLDDDDDDDDDRLKA